MYYLRIITETTNRQSGLPGCWCLETCKTTWSLVCLRPVTCIFTRSSTPMPKQNKQANKKKTRKSKQTNSLYSRHPPLKK